MKTTLSKLMLCKDLISCKDSLLQYDHLNVVLCLFFIHRVEKIAINSVIKMSSQSQTYSGEDLSLSVVKMDLNTTNKSVPVTAPLVRLQTHLVLRSHCVWNTS